MSLTHFSFYTLQGAGDLHYVRDERPLSDSNYTIGAPDFVCVIKPELNAGLNVIIWLRVDAGLFSRLVMDVNQIGLGNGDLSGLAAMRTYKFSRF
jgi:hypothetical protein